MIEIVLYASLMISALAGIFLGWHLAYVIADPAKKTTAKSVSQITKKHTKEATQEAPTISIKDKINGRKGASLTEFECELDGTDEASVIQTHQHKSNTSYQYLKRLD